MRDFLGNDIEVNDDVVFMAIGYRSLVKGKVIKLTPKKVQISYSNNWNFNVRLETCYQEPSQIIKVIK